MTDPLDTFDTFVAELRARLEAGRRTYGDRSFDRAPGDLLGELEQELLDVCGWSVVMFERIRRLRERVQDVAQAGRVRVVPIVLRPGVHGFQGYPAVDLPRLPQARELLELQAMGRPVGVERFDGGTFRVQLVRMTPQAPGGTDADVYLSPMLLDGCEALLAQEAGERA